MRHYDRTSVPTLDDVHPVMVSQRYRQLAEYQTQDQYTVTLWQNQNGFAVTYGLQLAAQLTYAQACQELGECLLHQLTCAGLVKEN